MDGLGPELPLHPEPRYGALLDGKRLDSLSFGELGRLLGERRREIEVRRNEPHSMEHERAAPILRKRVERPSNAPHCRSLCHTRPWFGARPRAQGCSSSRSSNGSPSPRMPTCTVAPLELVAALRRSTVSPAAPAAVRHEHDAPRTSRAGAREHSIRLEAALGRRRCRSGAELERFEPGSRIRHGHEFSERAFDFGWNKKSSTSASSKCDRYASSVALGAFDEVGVGRKRSVDREHDARTARHLRETRRRANGIAQ